MSDDVLTILDNGESRDIDAASATSLEKDGLIYWCDSHDCGPFYHISPGKTWDDVDKALEWV